MPHRRPTVAAAGLSLAAALCLAAVAPASARVLEVGRADAAPTCPSPCLAVSRTTGYQSKVAGRRGMTTIPQDGWIVAWSIALGRPTGKQIRYFDRGQGGAAAAQLTILRPRGGYGFRTVGQSRARHLRPYFGQTVQFPLGTTLKVRRGDVIALTVPTWAPALTGLLSDGSSWRAPRPSGRCEDKSTQTAQTGLGTSASYPCAYAARLGYSATLVTRPAPTASATVAR